MRRRHANDVHDEAYQDEQGSDLDSLFVEEENLGATVFNSSSSSRLCYYYGAHLNDKK